MKHTITLKDGEHVLKPATTYTGELIRTWQDDPIGPVAVTTAALLTSSEGLNPFYRPFRTWYPGEVAQLLPDDNAEREAIAVVVYDLLVEAGILKTEAGDESGDPRTPGDGSQSKRRAISKS